MKALKRMTKVQAIVSAVALAALLSACVLNGEANGARAEATVAESSSSSARGTAAVRCSARRGGQQGVFTNLVDVRVGRHARYDRIVFEFAAPRPNPGGKAGIPAYEIRTATPPLLRDGSGQPMSVNGRAFAGLVFHGASGYDFEGRRTYDGPNRLRPRFPVLVEAAKAGDFEATLSWYLGLRYRACWTVRELHSPARVVIDFAH